VSHVLIAGGGVAALEATLALRALADDAVDIELLAPEEKFVYRPASVAEPFHEGGAWSLELEPLVEAAGARLTRGSLSGVDLETRRAWTADGVQLTWDVLILAIGARMGDGVQGSLVYRGPNDYKRLASVIAEAAMGRFDSLTFALPAGVAWGLPLYELALMARVTLEDAASAEVRVDVVTPEEEPLGVFGEAGSASVKRTLEARGVGLRVRSTPVVFRDGWLEIVPHGWIPTDQVISLPVPEGQPIEGIPSDHRGFVPTDSLGRVAGRADVYAAGDITSFPIKQGGIAAQQADAVAEAIAASVGVPVEPRPFEPVLRGLMFTGLSPRFLQGGLLDDSSEVGSEPMWSPPEKIAARYLAPFLARRRAASDPDFEEAA
jgi:sulfide:quinone oxidoreductase